MYHPFVLIWLLKESRMSKRSMGIEVQQVFCFCINNQFQLQNMGGCIPDSTQEAKHRLHKTTNNPIPQIIAKHSIQTLREKWDMHQLKTMQEKMFSLPSNHVRFQQFSQLFPKIRDFSNTTQDSIYKLFAYNGDKELSREQIVNTLTLLRKVNQNSDFAPFLFYVYSSDSRHSFMTQNEMKIFKQENQQFLKRLPLSQTNEIQAEILEEDEGDFSKEPSIRKSQKQPQKVQRNQNPSYIEGPSSRSAQNTISNAGKSITLQNGSSNKYRQSNSLGKKEKQLNNTGQSLQTTKNGVRREPAQRMISLFQFKQEFSKYNLLAYQMIFSWDLKEEEKELVQELQRQGIKLTTNDKVYVTDHYWWLEWTQYVQAQYNIKIEFEKRPDQNYYSAKSNIRRQSISKGSDSPVKKNGKELKPPGEIRNGRLLKEGKNRNELIPNLVEFDNYICLPSHIWNKLVAIYHGGPPIERTYPQIYNSLILKAFIGDDKFFFRLKKYSKNDGFKLQNIRSKKQEKGIPYYKYPGRNNWAKLPDNPNQQAEIFNSIRTYLVFVPKETEARFLQKYNIHETKEGRIIERRFRNYGFQINISIDGVLTKAEVVQIISHQTIRVAYLTQNGILKHKVIEIDDKLQQINPKNLDSQKKINELPGLRNLGNTCYINAVLQCLIRTPYFGSYLQKQDFNREKKRVEEDELLLEEVAKLQKDSQSYHTLDLINTKSFKRVVDKHCPMFQGNLQHDSQQFLICLLSRLSEQIKSKAEYGSVRQSRGPKQINKQIVKFFSGQTQAITQCLKCNNQNKRIEPFFTYSVSLPEQKQSEYSYFMVDFTTQGRCNVPVQYGITLDRKITVQNFIKEIAKHHRKQADNLVLFSVFNNQLLNKLEPSSWQEVSHHLNFNVKLVFYEVQHTLQPTYYSYQRRELSNRSVKLQLRQRVYSAAAKDYKITYMPFILEITSQMRWADVIQKVHLIIQQLSFKGGQTAENGFGNTHSKLSMSGIKVEVGGLQTGRKSSRDERGFFPDGKPYKIRVVRNDHHFQNNCFFCKGQFVWRRSRNTQNCFGQRCSFALEKPLFQDQEFKNFNDSILITVDWQESKVPQFPKCIVHSSYEKSVAKAEARKDYLEELLVNSFKNKQVLELRCEKKDCQYELAQRLERIALPPNILLLHIKRFRYEDNRLIKLTNRVVYPHKLTLPGTSTTYLLYGVVVHYGSGVGGHYVSYVRVNGKWYYCDDSKVTLAEKGAEIDTNAYLLFYHTADFAPSLVCLSF